jgi:glycine/D-amino acid oxidase-like deaminating enzyme
MTSSSREQKRPRVAVIGGGIFGVTAALALARFGEVRLFEKARELFQGATFANHNRQHYGFHYPRSAETARQCLESRGDFRRLYGEAERADFANYYCIAAASSKVGPDDYIRFCDAAGLHYKPAAPPKEYVDLDKIALSLRVEEGVVDFATLKRIALSLLEKEPRISVCTEHAVTGGEILADGAKRLVISRAGAATEETFDFVINATYAHSNSFCEWFGFATRKFQFNLQELAIVELPPGVRIGATIMDGAFPSILPMGGTPYHLLAHVNASQLLRESSHQSTPLLSRVAAIESNWEGIRQAAIEYLPLVKEARYVKSLFVDRVVDAGAAQTDARLTDLTDHGAGCFSIFAAKVITCVSTADKLAEMIRGRL